MIEEHPEEILERLIGPTGVTSQVHDQSFGVADFVPEGKEVIGIVEEPRKLKNDHIADL